MGKFEKLESVMRELGLSRQEVVNYLTNPQSNSSVAIDITHIKPGMYWNEDNTFSTEQKSDKVKAIVELVEDGVIYGDLTASELFDIKEQKLPWNEAKKFIESFSYPCQDNEKIVWYTYKQLQCVWKNYGQVKKAFVQLSKNYRYGWNWSSVKQSEVRAFSVAFDRGTLYGSLINNLDYIRPVIALKVF